LQASILQLKTRPLICKKVEQLLQSTFEIDEKLRSSETIIPVPLHSERLRERGFNQAALIAERLFKNTGVSLDSDSLTRVKATAKHRAGMDLHDRNQSVGGAFRVLRPRLIEGATVVLVDDVFTTGSTLSACAKALFDAGAKQVNLFTLARVVGS
jgi:ComF family protein